MQVHLCEQGLSFEFWEGKIQKIVMDNFGSSISIYYGSSDFQTKATNLFQLVTLPLQDNLTQKFLKYFTLQNCIKYLRSKHFYRYFSVFSFYNLALL